MSSQDLIKSLSENVQPVVQIRFGAKQYAASFFAGIFSVMAGLALSGLRFDIESVYLTPRFIFESIVLLVLAFFSIVSALQMSIPSLETRLTKYLVGITLSTWYVALIYFLINSEEPIAGWGFDCSRDVVLFSLIPSAVIFFLTQKAAALNRMTVGFLTLTAGAAFGALATQFSCFMSNPLHVLVWHALPVVIIGLVGIAAGKLIMKKL